MSHTPVWLPYQLPNSGTAADVWLSACHTSSAYAHCTARWTSYTLPYTSTATAGAAKEDLAAAVARTRREERLAADQRLTQSLQNQQQRLQQQHQQQLQEQLQRQQLQKQQSAVRRESSHLQLSLSESADFQALQQKLHEAVARCATLLPSARLHVPKCAKYHIADIHNQRIASARILDWLVVNNRSAGPTGGPDFSSSCWCLLLLMTLTAITHSGVCSSSKHDPLK